MTSIITSYNQNKITRLGIFFSFTSILHSVGLFAQVTDTTKKPEALKRFNAHYQFTAIDQFHGPFTSPYQGPSSLQPVNEQAMSVTSTLFLGARLWKNASLYLNPEISGGKGFSDATGIAGFPNGEIYRVGNPTPQLYLARLVYRQNIALPGATYKLTEEDPINQIPEYIPDKRISIIIGKFCLADYYDNNAYSHDARTQFLNWALMDNGAWDYPANTRGYTGSAIIEYDNKGFSMRFGAALEPTYANGPVLDWNITKTLGYTFEADHHLKIGKREGNIGLLLYCNIDRGGNYEQAVALKKSGQDSSMNVSTLTAYDGNKKYGFGISYDQQLTDRLGIFARIGWNDGQTATWAFTEIDQTASVGISIDKPVFKKTDNTFGLALLVDGISSEHRDFLNNGGVDFIIGDGKLPHYGTENILETYYNVKLTEAIAIALDYQFVQNPGYNKDRGPVPYIISVRLHIEL